VSRRAAVLVLAMVLPTLLAWLYLVVLARDDGPGGVTSVSRAPARNPAVGVAYGVSKAFQFSLPLIYVWWLERRPLRPGVPHFRGMALGVAFGLVVAVAAVGLYPISARYPGLFESATVKIRAKVAEFGIGTPATYVLFGLFLSLGHSLLEEYYWRWFVFGQLREFLPRWPAVVLSSLAFMAHHVILLGVFFPGQFWSMAAPLSLGVAGGGAVWAWLYDRTGSIYSPWLSHAIIDAAVLWVGYEMVFGANV
jgi:membrane protease YdiL (CAAX protease family)